MIWSDLPGKPVEVGRTRNDQPIQNIGCNKVVYVSDFGTLTLVPHPYALTTAVIGIDRSMWAVGVLRGWMTQKLAKTGDSDREEILAEHTLIARNEKSSWSIQAV